MVVLADDMTLAIGSGMCSGMMLSVQGAGIMQAGESVMACPHHVLQDWHTCCISWLQLLVA